MGSAKREEDFTYSEGYYIPKDPSDNIFRHFGIRVDGKLLLRYEEFKFLTSDAGITHENLEEGAYFELKALEYNILDSEDSKRLIYRKTKHFNRNNASPLGKLEFRARDDNVEFFNDPTIVAVKGQDLVSFLKINPIEDLNFDLDLNLKKK